MKNFKEWLKAAAIRAAKTVAQTAIATIGTTAVFSAVDWKITVGSALFSGVLSLLTSVAGLPEINAKKVASESSDTENG